MGYTHYWDRIDVVDVETYEAIIKDIKKVLPFVLGDFEIAGFDGKGRAMMEKGRINFNGLGDEGHENFYFPRMHGSNQFNFTKTARKPYDLLVTICLSIMKVHMPVGIHVVTDGENEDWEPAFKICSNILGHEYDNLDITEVNSKLRYKRWENFS
jgi:hypothetical protein